MCIYIGSRNYIIYFVTLYSFLKTNQLMTKRVELLIIIIIIGKCVCFFLPFNNQFTGSNGQCALLDNIMEFKFVTVSCRTIGFRNLAAVGIPTVKSITCDTIHPRSRRH